MERNDGGLDEHPVLAKLAGETDVVTLLGYVGKGSSDASIRLYTTLHDLSRSIEIAKSDILHSQAAPDSILVYGGTTLWVKKNASLAVHNVGPQAAKDLVEVNRGRLRIAINRDAVGMRRDDCQVCQSRCNCQSTCGGCNVERCWRG